jgi:hypothetical protein
MSSPKVRKRKSKYPFVLKDIDIEEISKRYGFSYNQEICNINKIFPRDNVTKLDEIIITPENEFSYLDETKNKRKFIITLIDCTTKEKLKLVQCFWCRHSFDSTPLGCPIKYVPHCIVKKYFSYITKDYYTIKEEISNTRFEELKADIQDTELTVIQLAQNDYYETDGVFCSFNCCLAWIKDNPTNNLYINSIYLLHEIYNKCFDTQHQIQAAPHWRLLTGFGGHMSIYDFRSSFNKIIYDNSHVIKTIPKTKPIGMVFEEFLKI